VRVLSPVGVQLLTEQELLDRRGERTGSTDATPAAQQFASEITALLRAGSVPRYAQLVNDFRLIEIAQLMHFVGVDRSAIEYLLTGRTLAAPDVPTVVAGVRRDEQGEIVCRTVLSQTEDGIHSRQQIQSYRYEYRGGVEAHIKLTRDDFGPGNDCQGVSLRERVLAARPSPEILDWPVSE
jgi:hypothetical protein